MSGSMMRYGRFLAAKKVALAMQGLVRQRFESQLADLLERAPPLSEERFAQEVQ